MTSFYKFNPFFLAILFLLFIGCKKKNTSPKMTTPKLAAIEDKKADALASKMMDAMGGVDKWNDLKYVSWSFFGARHLVWDKENGRVRIDSPRDTSVYLMDINTLEGKVLKGGQVISDTLVLKKQLSRAKSIWINDSYWLFMPFKLWDPGVNVSYVREDTMIGGAPSSVLALTFENVGLTPDNKYEVHIDHEDNLIKQWAFFKTATQEEPPRVWPWDNYKDFGGLMLSQDRSDKSGPSNVRVYETLDDVVFESLEPFDYF